jgi:hypothetical protein
MITASFAGCRQKDADDIAKLELEKILSHYRKKAMDKN